MRENAAVSPSLRIDMLLELAHWYQISGAVRDALKICKEVWFATVESGKPGESVLGEPTPLLYRAAVGVAGPTTRKHEGWVVDSSYACFRCECFTARSYWRFTKSAYFSND